MSYIVLWAIIASNILLLSALRAENERLLDALRDLRQNVDYHGHKKLDAALKDDERAADDERCLRARVAKLEAALKDIAKQMINAEMDETQHRYADYEGAYETMIKVARAALSGQ